MIYKNTKSKKILLWFLFIAFLGVLVGSLIKYQPSVERCYYGFPWEFIEINRDFSSVLKGIKQDIAKYQNIDSGKIRDAGIGVSGSGFVPSKVKYLFVSIIQNMLFWFAVSFIVIYFVYIITKRINNYKIYNILLLFVNNNKIRLALFFSITVTFLGLFVPRPLGFINKYGIGIPWEFIYFPLEVFYRFDIKNGLSINSQYYDNFYYRLIVLIINIIVCFVMAYFILLLLYYMAKRDTSVFVKQHLDQQ